MISKAGSFAPLTLRFEELIQPIGAKTLAQMATTRYVRHQTNGRLYGQTVF